MISIGNIPSSGGAYYTSEQNYYTEGSGLSLWHGGAKQALGLKDGAIAAKGLDSIISGRRPDGKPISGVNLNRVRKTGIDITFSAPKSVSLLAMTDQAPIIYDIQTKAVKRALDFAEKHLATTRIKNPETGKQDHVLGQKMISGLFLHDLSRNNDPQIHTHCVVANLMMDKDGRFRAHHNKPFFDHQMVLSAVYRAQLARGLQREGYALRMSGRNGLFEIKDISPKTLERFSTRSKEIHQSLKENDISAEARSRAALTTRKSKTSINRPELVKRWNATLAKDGLSLKTLPESIKSRELLLSQNSEKILEAAILDASERNSQFTYLDVMKTAMTDGIGHSTIDEIDKHFSRLQKTGRLISLPGSSNFTTPEILADEKAILKEHDKGHLKGKPIGKLAVIRDDISEAGLSKDQQEAAVLILSSRSRFVGIQGTAGTGKTTMLRTALPIAAQQGHTIIGIAPSGAATQELEETACFHKTMTTTQFLLTPQTRRNTIIVLDEASMVGNKDMLSLLKIANKGK